ncbi:replication-associated recombination protein A [Jonesia quinghaiensis]|uniref:replication-associated recombination protein A n=1 Tax=Jonesia quinghaiensis TaxID=262806 RepID=UPI0003FC427F|nr:replication-associated recombination protein A [Jonesia quinghaiensis]
MDLFHATSTTNHGTPKQSPTAPLAVRMRPQSAEEVAGQHHLLTPGSPLRRLLEPHTATTRTAPSSIILWGPPGTGKTTLAYLIAHSSDRHFTELSAVTAGVKDIRTVVDSARQLLVTNGQETVLFIDEVHRFSKSQQDALLPSVENRWVTLIAATTENPSFSVISPLLSRSLLLTLRSLTDDDITALLTRALADERGLAGTVTLHPDAQSTLVRLAQGDARKALTILEAAASSATATATTPNAPATITTDVLEQAIDIATVSYDKDGDQHYDVTSAFIKSMRGSDVDAALHYLARMLVAGEDPRFIARRIVISASEDVGMADPSALQTATAAAQAVQLLGLPEARYALAQAVVHIATAPKSNKSHDAINAAISDIQAGRTGQVPPHLRDSHYSGAQRLGHGAAYQYAHDYPHAVAPQHYLPEELQGTRYYHPTDRGFERNVTQRLEIIRTILPNNNA